MRGNVTDWINVACNLIQTILGVVGLIIVKCWWEKRNEKARTEREDQQTREKERRTAIQREQDRQIADQKRREEERQRENQREEDRQRADAEKIAAILSENYNEVKNIFDRVKKIFEKLRKVEIDGGLTDFDVLLYMWRPYNWRKFEGQHPDTKNPRSELLSDVEKMTEFFFKFRINLFSIMQNRTCPDDIKEEFSSKITEMGETIYPFVVEHRQGVIKRVLNYFATQGFSLRDYPGDATIENAFPYLKYFSYQGKNEMSLNFVHQHSVISNLMRDVKLGKMQKEKKEILEKLRLLWRVNQQADCPPGDSLLHLIRMTMFKLSEHQDSLSLCQNSLDDFKQYVRTFISFLDGGNLLKWERMLSKIEYCLDDLKGELDPRSVLGKTKAQLGKAKGYLEEAKKNKNNT